MESPYIKLKVEGSL